MDQASLDFGNVLVGNPSDSRSLKITNVGQGPLILSSVALAGADAAAFKLVTPTQPITLQPGASTVLSVSLTPDAERPFTALVVGATNDANNSSLSVPLTGTGTRQQIQLAPSPLDFGHQLINHASNPRKVNITNNNSKTNVTLVKLELTGTGAEKFKLLNPPPLPLVLTPNHSTDVTLAVTPLDQSDVNSTMRLTFSELPQPLEVALHSKGISSVISISPSPLDFGTVRIRTRAPLQPLTIKNPSSEAITLVAPTVNYSTGESFTYAVLGADGGTLAAGVDWIALKPDDSSQLMVGYQPQIESLSETDLSFDTNPPQSQALAVQLKGRATQSILTLDPGSLDFGRVDVDVPVDPKVVTINNTSSQQQRVVVKLRDFENSPYTLQSKALANPIPPGGSATFMVAFAPQTAGQVDNEVQVWLQGATVAEMVLPVTGHGRNLTGKGGGCSCDST